MSHDIDEIAVTRRCNGDRTVPLTRAEAAEAWARLEQEGLGHRTIAARLGIAARTVLRWRSGVRPYGLRGVAS